MALVLICLISMNVYSEENKIIEVVKLENSTKISDADSVNTALSKVTEAVSKCRKSGGETTFCMCNQSELHDKLKTKVTTVLNKYPEWKSGAVNYLKEGIGYTVSFVGLSLQFKYFNESCNKK